MDAAHKRIEDENLVSLECRRRAYKMNVSPFHFIRAVGKRWCGYLPLSECAKVAVTKLERGHSELQVMRRDMYRIDSK